MATFDDYQDDLATCPYNPAHKVARRRLQAHLVKCEKNSALPLMQCPFNSSHRMEPHEYQKHLDSCPDSFQVMREMQQQTELAKMKKEEKREFVPEKMVVAEDEDDDWNSSSAPDKNYVIPALRDDVDQLKDRVEGYVDPLILQRMSRSEKEKFYEERLKTAKTRIEEEERRKGNPSDFKLKVKEEGDRGKGKGGGDEGPSAPQSIHTFGGVGRGRPRN